MTSVKGKRVIFVGPAGGAKRKPLLTEGLATQADLLPGMIIRRTAAGTGFEKALFPPTVFGVDPLLADRDFFKAKQIDEPWDINETMVVIQPRSGEFVNALVINAQPLAKGTALRRTNNGLLEIALTDGSQEIFGFSDETVTTVGTQLVCVRKL